MKYNDKDEKGRALDIPDMYKVPFIKIAEHERTEQDKRGQVTIPNMGQWYVKTPCKRLTLHHDLLFFP